MLVQNTEGLAPAAIKNATVATCESTLDFCLAESCSDSTVGIDCICEVAGGKQVAFPTDCMQARALSRGVSGLLLHAESLYRRPTPRQSAVMEVPVPSTSVLTYIVPKPHNETSEFVLANVRPLFCYRFLDFSSISPSLLVMPTDGRVVDGMDNAQQQ